MKFKLILRKLLIRLTGVFFAAYSVFNIFIIVKDGRMLRGEAVFISGIVALLFGMLTAFAWTTEIKNPRLHAVRIIAFIAVIVALFALKLRMVDKVIAYFDSKTLHTILYGGAYFMTQAALFTLFIYYAFILKYLPLFPKASLLFPSIALGLFAVSFALEIILFFVYGIGLEASPLRTIAVRPMFYFGFMGLSAYFLFPPQLIE